MMLRNNIHKSHRVQVAQRPFVVTNHIKPRFSEQSLNSELLEYGLPEASPPASDPSKVAEEAEKLLQAAEEEANEIRRVAHLEGVEAGRSQGYAEGISQANADGEEKAGETLATARRLVGEVRRWRSEMILNSESTIIEMTNEITAKLFGNGFRLPPEQLEAVVAQTLEHARNLTNLKIHLHPEDVTRLQPLWSDSAIDLIADDEIEPGGCLIVGDQGEVDARVPVQLKRISESLSSIAEAS